MFHFVPRGNQPAQAPMPHVSFEALEDRRMLSASGLTALAATSSSVSAVDVTATARKKFHDVVGSWTVAGGLPTRASGIAAIAVVDWGDGKTSRAKLVDDGSGVVQIVGSHAWKQPGTFQTVVKIEEFPRAHRHQLTVIGEGDGSAVVAPRPHRVKLKGTLTGTYTTPLSNPDARHYSFTGTGTAKALGAVNASGTITPPGFIRSAPATGEFTLTGATGSVTISLTGRPQNGGSPLPQKMKYVVTGGTGAFANAGGKGTVSIAVDTTANTFVIVIH